MLLTEEWGYRVPAVSFLDAHVSPRLKPALKLPHTNTLAAFQPPQPTAPASQPSHQMSQLPALKPETEAVPSVTSKKKALGPQLQLPALKPETDAVPSVTGEKKALGPQLQLPALKPETGAVPSVTGEKEAVVPQLQLPALKPETDVVPSVTGEKEAVVPHSQLPALRPKTEIVPSVTGEENALVPQIQQLSALRPVTKVVPSVIGEKDDLVVIVPASPKLRLRPTISGYRALSGLLSFLVVSLLLCGALGYYLHTNGAWDRVSSLIRTAPQPVSTSTSGVVKADPPTQIEKGPTFDVIPVAATSAHLSSGMAAGQDTVFTVNQTIYLGFTVQSPPADGTVTIKWYLNNRLVATPEKVSVVTADGPSQSRISSMIFSTRGQGAVELYWNNQLAQKLYFVVR